MVARYTGNLIVSTIDTNTNIVSNKVYKFTVTFDVVQGTNNLAYKFKITSNFTGGEFLAYREYDDSSNSNSYYATFKNIDYKFHVNDYNKLILQASGVRTNSQFTINGLLNPF